MMSAPLGEDVARDQREPVLDATITLTESALTAHREARELIQRARMWCENLTDLIEGEGMDERTLDARRKLLAEMELSYYTNLAHVLTMTQGWDGPLTVWRDGEACMYWRHTPRVEGRRGMEGGLVFHRNLTYSKPGEKLTVGTWSVHT